MPPLPLAPHPLQLDFWLSNGIFLAVYALFLTERLPKVVVALLGASAVILCGILTQAQAFAYVDWNVIFLLVGMMIIVNILKQTGVFDWLAIQTARRVGDNALHLMLALCVITAISSAVLDNVTTVLFMATVTCALAEKLKINPIPLLISEVMAANIGGTATLIGDPPNILIASAGKLSFLDFLVHVAPIVTLILPVSLAILAWLYRRELVFTEASRAALANLSPDGTINDARLLRIGIIVLGLVLMGFVLHHTIHQEVGTIALAGAAVLMLFEDPKSLWDDVEWDTIFFFIGLFIVVGAVEAVGTLDILAHTLLQATHGSMQQLTMALLWVSGIASAVIDNIPYTATMIPVIQSLGVSAAEIKPLWWALSLGACLGGNGTLIGATANVVAADIAAYRCGQRIHFGEFLKVGAVVTVVSLTMSAGYLWLRYLR